MASSLKLFRCSRALACYRSISRSFEGASILRVAPTIRRCIASSTSPPTPPTPPTPSPVSTALNTWQRPEGHVTGIMCWNSLSSSLVPLVVAGSRAARPLSWYACVGSTSDATTRNDSQASQSAASSHPIGSICWCTCDRDLIRAGIRVVQLSTMRHTSVTHVPTSYVSAALFTRVSVCHECVTLRLMTTCG